MAKEVPEGKTVLLGLDDQLIPSELYANVLFPCPLATQIVPFHETELHTPVLIPLILNTVPPLKLDIQFLPSLL